MYYGQTRVEFRSGSQQQTSDDDRAIKTIQKGLAGQRNPKTEWLHDRACAVNCTNGKCVAHRRDEFDTGVRHDAE